MRLLVLGGTAWLGGLLVDAACAKGHDVTCLARGTSGIAPRGAALARADRALPGAYEQVLGQRWDCAIDVSRQPGQVGSAASVLAKVARAFVFVSSASVYADHSRPGGDESGALLAPLEGDVMEDMNSYGQAKVACEQQVLAAFGEDRSLIVRAGLIGGPGDASDRTGYWPLRFARAAATARAVLVPDASRQPTQVIDARDLAHWIIDRACAGDAGTFNACGETIGFREHIEIARHVGGHRGVVVSAGSDWLLRQGVTPWMGPKSLPLWLPAPDYAGFAARDSSAAEKAGLSRRSLEATLHDTLAWELSRVPSPMPRRAGLSDEDEAFLLGIANVRELPTCCGP